MWFIYKDKETGLWEYNGDNMNAGESVVYMMKKENYIVCTNAEKKHIVLY